MSPYSTPREFRPIQCQVCRYVLGDPSRQNPFCPSDVSASACTRESVNAIGGDISRFLVYIQFSEQTSTVMSNQYFCGKISSSNHCIICVDKTSPLNGKQIIAFFLSTDTSLGLGIFVLEYLFTKSLRYPLSLSFFSRSSVSRLTVSVKHKRYTLQ